MHREKKSNPPSLARLRATFRKQFFSLWHLTRRKALLLVILCILGVVYGALYTVISPRLPKPEEPLLFYANQQRQDLKLLFSRAIQKAHSSILLHIYALTDPDLLELLKEKAQKGVSITIFYDPSASPALKKGLGPGIFIYPIHCRGLMHRKILIIDGKQVFIGSANFTPSSLRKHSNLVIGLYHPDLAHFLTTCPQSHYPFTLQGKQAELWLLPDRKQQALKRLLSLIEEAKEEISLSMFTLTHPLLTKALIAAHERGVKVLCTVDFYTGYGASYKTVRQLALAGITVRLSQGPQLLHHKWAYIDHTHLIIGSTNWTESAFKNNHDCFLVLYSLDSLHQKQMDKLSRILELESRPLHLLQTSTPK